MARLTLALLAFCCFLPAATATMSPQRNLPLFERHFQQVARARPVRPLEPKSDLVITSNTDVKLDGRPCQLKDLPEGAEIILLEVAADKKTVQAIHFRSKK